MSGVFISYRHDGGFETAILLAYRLGKDGYKVFFDKTSMRSGEFDKQLFLNIDEASDFVVILDHNVFKSTLENGMQIKDDDWLPRELAYAIKKGKNIIPVKLPGFSEKEIKDKLPEDIRDVFRYQSPIYSKAYFDEGFYNDLTKKLKTPAPIKKRVSKIIMPVLLLAIAGAIGFYLHQDAKPPILGERPLNPTDTTSFLVVMGGGSVWNYINAETSFKDSLHNYKYIYLPMASETAWPQIGELRSVPDINPNSYPYHLVLLSARKAVPEKMIPAEKGQGTFLRTRGYIEEIKVGQSRLQVAINKKGNISINSYLDIINGDTVITVNKLVKLLKEVDSNLVVYTTNKESGTYFKFDSLFKAHSFGMDSIKNKEPFVDGQIANDFARNSISLETTTYYGVNNVKDVLRYGVYDEASKLFISNDLFIYFVVFGNHNEYFIPEIVRGFLDDIGIVMPENCSDTLNNAKGVGLIQNKPTKQNKLLHPTK